jgi:sigma-B regulation protein RsbU (phosphoserine phosphatase)
MVINRNIVRLSPRGEVVLKIISSFNYVYENEKIFEVSSEVAKSDDIKCLGVVDSNKKVKGILTRDKIFDFIGRPYGQEVLRFKDVSFLTTEAPHFYLEENIFSVAEKLKNYLKVDKPEYFIVKDKDEKFIGIFSNIDLMIYLSEALRKDLELASHLQQSIVNEETIIEKGNFSLLAYSRMAKEIGGDFYFIRDYSKEIFISLCDVSGKGVSASLLTTFLAGSHLMLNQKIEIAEVIKKINRDLYTIFKLQKFITAIFLKIDLKNKNIDIYDMGHSLIYLLRDEKIYHLKTSVRNLPLGIKDEIEVEKRSLDFEKGDIVAILTDGIVEQVNSNFEEFGIERTMKIIQSYKNESLKTIKDILIQELNHFRENQPQSDDTTFIIVKF